LGVSVRPTAEELAERERRYEEIRNSPFAKQQREILSASNYLLADIYKNNTADLFAVKNFKIGSTLRIRLPNDYVVKENKNG